MDLTISVNMWSNHGAKGDRTMPRKGENIKRRNDERWEARFCTINTNGKKCYSLCMQAAIWRSSENARSWCKAQVLPRR